MFVFLAVLIVARVLDLVLALVILVVRIVHVVVLWETIVRPRGTQLIGWLVSWYGSIAGRFVPGVRRCRGGVAVKVVVVMVMVVAVVVVAAVVSSRWCSSSLWWPSW